MNKQKGFSLVEGLLIVLIVSVVGFGGYTVWNNQQDKETEKLETNLQKTAEANSNDETKETSEKATSIPEGWVLYRSEESAYSLAYPKDWHVSDDNSTSVTVSPSADGSIPNIYVWLAELDNSSCDQTENKLTSLMIDGVPAVQFTGGAQTNKTTTCIVHSDKVYHVVHSYFEEVSSLKNDYNQLLETFKFN